MQGCDEACCKTRSDLVSGLCRPTLCFYLEIQMKCRSVSAQTHTPPLPPLSSLSTLALILPLVPLSSSLHLWMSGFLFRFASFCRTLKRRWDGVTEESEERFSLFVSAELRCGERRCFLFFRCRLDQTLRDCVFPEIDDRTFVHFTSRITARVSRLSFHFSVFWSFGWK